MVVLMLATEGVIPLDGKVDRPIEVFNRWFWVIAFLGLGRLYLNRKHRFLQYVSEAAYPVYILHFGVVALIAYYLAVQDWPVELKWLAIVSSSAAATLAIYDLVVKRTSVTRFLFGMKPKKGPAPKA